MINLSYKVAQNSSTIELAGMPDVSNGDSNTTIGILSSWTLKIIGSPILEGEKEHLDELIQVIFKYSRSYISGFRNTYISNKNIVSISPSGENHKLILNSTRKGVKSLEIILDDSELSDLTRCFDLLIFDSRFNINWNIDLSKPFSKRYVARNTNNSNNGITCLYSFILFILCSTILILVPINNKYEIQETSNTSIDNSSKINY